MNEYKRKSALSKRSEQPNSDTAAPQSVNGIPNSVLTDVFAGKRSATSDMMGHREELAPSIAAKMSQSFGMDFSALKVYRSDAMVGTEMQGMAQGDRVVLSSDVDLNTMEGQATLGHELSHIRAQSMGMGSGRGLLNDASLEHRADSEGMLAARGMSISGEGLGMSMGLGMAGMEGLSPIGAGLSASAGAPMQASKGDKNAISETGEAETAEMADELEGVREEENSFDIKEDHTGYNNVITNIPWRMDNKDFSAYDTFEDNMSPTTRAEQRLREDADPNGGRLDRLKKRGEGLPLANMAFSPDENGEERVIRGLGIKRIHNLFMLYWAKDHDDDEIIDMLEKMSAGETERTKDGNLIKSTHPEPGDPKHDAKRMEGLNQYKGILYKKMKTLENKFGSTLTQMHPRDIMERMGVKQYLYYSMMMQDAQQIFNHATTGKEAIEMVETGSDDPKRDEEMKRMTPYYNKLFGALAGYLWNAEHHGALDAGSGMYMEAKQLEGNIHGPRMDEDQLKSYHADIRKKIDSGAYEEMPQVLYQQGLEDDRRYLERNKKKK